MDPLSRILYQKLRRSHNVIVQRGAILLISLIMVAVIAAIGVAFGSIATSHKTMVTAQTKGLDAKLKSTALRNAIHNNLRNNINDPTNPCKDIPNCIFLDQAAGAALPNLIKGALDNSWWVQNSQENFYSQVSSSISAASGTAADLRYIIREISAPSDGSHIYEIITFAADSLGKYQHIARQYKILLNPQANQAPPPVS